MGKFDHGHACGTYFVPLILLTPHTDQSSHGAFLQWIAEEKSPS